jgi:acetyl esterase
MTTPPFLTPSVAGLLAQVNAGPPGDPSPAGQRTALDGAMAALGWPDAAAIQTMALSSGASMHLFAPDTGHAPWPLVVYLHGGSFVAGGVASHGGVAAALATRSGAMVALVDYRLAPEHPLPAALDDAIAAIDTLVADGTVLGCDPSRIAIVGDSAGGWLAASLVERYPDAARFARLVLINPMITPKPGRLGSRERFATGYFAGTADFDGAWQLAGDWIDGAVHPGDDPASLARFPPTCVITNEADPVRDEGEAFAELLSAAGVPVLNLRARGLIHAAWLFPKVLPEADLLLDVVGGLITAKQS